MKIIQIAYRKIITVKSTSSWEQFVFEDSYKEFRMQFQFYNASNNYATFSKLLADNPAADKLHFLVSSAVTGYIAQLGGKIPDVQNALGKTFLPFHLYRFEIIDSNIHNKNEHRIAIIFYSEPVQWIDSIGEQILLSTDTANDSFENAIHTELLKLQPFISIHSFQETDHAKAISSQNIPGR